MPGGKMKNPETYIKELEKKYDQEQKNQPAEKKLVALKKLELEEAELHARLLNISKEKKLYK